MEQKSYFLAKQQNQDAENRGRESTAMSTDKGKDKTDSTLPVTCMASLGNNLKNIINITNYRIRVSKAASA